MTIRHYIISCLFSFEITNLFLVSFFYNKQLKSCNFSFFFFRNIKDEKPNKPSSTVTSNVHDQVDHVSKSSHHIPKSSAIVNSSFASKEDTLINGEFDSRKLRPRNDKTDYNEDKKFHTLMNPQLEVINNNRNVNNYNSVQSQARQMTSREDKKNDHFAVVYKGHSLIDKNSSSNEASRLQQLLTKEIAIKEDIPKEISEHDTDCIDEESYFRYLNLISKSTREKKSDDYFKTTWPLRLIARSKPYIKVQIVQQLQQKPQQKQQQQQQQQSQPLPHVITHINNSKCARKETISSSSSRVTSTQSSSSTSMSLIQSKIQLSNPHSTPPLLESEAKSGRQFLAKQNWKNQVRAFNQNLDHGLIENSSGKRPLNNSLIMFTTKDTELKNGAQVYFNKYSQFYPLYASSKSPIKASFNQVENLMKQNFLKHQYLKFSNQYISKVDLSSPLGRRLLSNVPNHLRLTPSRSDLIPIYEKYCGTSNKSVFHSLINNMPNSSVISNPIKSRITRSNNSINGAVCASWGPRNYTHIYTFSKEQRLERAANLETGLDWKGRILSYCCKPCRVRLNVLTHCPNCEGYIGKSIKHECGEDKPAPVDNSSDRLIVQKINVDNQCYDYNNEKYIPHQLSVSKNVMNEKLSSHETLDSSNSNKPSLNILYTNSQTGVNKISTNSDIFKSSSVCLQCEHNYCNGSDCPFDVQLEERIEKIPLQGSVAKKSTSKPSSIKLKRKEPDSQLLLINDETKITHDCTTKDQPCLKRQCSSPSKILYQSDSSENVSIQRIDILTRTLSSKSNSKTRQEASKSRCSLNAVDEETDNDDDVVIIEEIINQRFSSNIVSFPKNITITPLTRAGMSPQIHVSASRNLIS